jgi:transposase
MIFFYQLNLKETKMVQLSSKILVCVDIGCQKHYVAMALSTHDSLQRLDGFPISHTPDGIDFFFKRLEEVKQAHQLPIHVAMEGYNGYARPIDTYVLEHGHRLFNLNNIQLANYKKLVRKRAKSDPVDSWKMVDLFRFHEMNALNSNTNQANVIQEVFQVDDVNAKLKRLTRRRSDLVQEKVILVNRIQSDIESICPGLASISGDVCNFWFLNFLTSIDEFSKLARIQRRTLLKIRGIGKGYADTIQQWQKSARFAPATEWVGPMVIRDAKHIYELIREIEQLEKILEALIPQSDIAKRIITIGGFGPISASVLGGEIGNIHRFPSEASLAVYLGMAVLDNSSGNYQGSRNPKNVNKKAKQVLMIAIDHHRKVIPEAGRYYQKKRDEGKEHNQAIRSLGRHLVRVIWSMLKNGRDYINKGELAKKDSVVDMAQECAERNKECRQSPLLEEHELLVASG